MYFPSLKLLDSGAPKMQNIDRLFNYYIKNSDESARVTTSLLKPIETNTETPSKPGKLP